MGDGGGDVEVGVGGDAGGDGGNEEIEDGDDEERSEEADRHVAAGVLRFLGGGADGIESEVGEEDDARSAQDASPSEVAPFAGGGRNEGMPVRRMDGVGRPGDEEEDDGELDVDDDVVRHRRFLDAEDQDGGGETDDEDGGEIEKGGDLAAVGQGDEGAVGGGEDRRQDQADLIEE